MSSKQNVEYGKDYKNDNEKNKEKINETIRNTKLFQYMQLEMIEFEEDRLKGRIPFKEDVLNPFGTMHGGMLFSLADTVVGFLANSYGKLANTTGANINYLRPAVNTEYVYCEAKILRRGDHLLVAAYEITNDDGTLLCEGSMTYFLLG